MQDSNKKVFEETDKYRKQPGRKAAETGNDSDYLNQEGLEDDLVETKNDDDDSGIVDPNHPENEEWNVRENENRH